MRRILTLKILVLVAIAFSVVHAAEEKECEKGRYLLIEGTVSGGAAEVVGIKAGDVVVSYNGTEVHCLEKLNILKKAVAADTVVIMIRRSGANMSFTVPHGMIGIYVKEMWPEFKYDKDAVVIKNIGRLGWDTGESNSFIGALTRIADYLNIDKDYTYLMGASGAAFRILFHEDWCPSSPDATVGYDCGEVAAHCINLAPTTLHLDKAEMDQEKIQQKIKTSIDNKMPVIAVDLIEVPEWGLVVGHQKNGKELIVRTYFDRRKGYDMAEKFPWVVTLIEKGEDKIDDSENFKNSLKIAQELYETEKYKKYYSGIAAIEFWIRRLKEDTITALNDEQFENVMLANAWIFQRLADDRMFAVEYLKSFATKFVNVSDEIMKLATLYEAENGIMQEPMNIAPYPSQIKERKQWTAQMRTKEIKILTEVLEKEKEAYSLIKEINKKLHG